MRSVAFEAVDGSANQNGRFSSFSASDKTRNVLSYAVDLEPAPKSYILSLQEFGTKLLSHEHSILSTIWPHATIIVSGVHAELSKIFQLVFGDTPRRSGGKIWGL
jgi:hypothetical protein